MEIFVKSFAKMYFLMIPQLSGGPTAAQIDFRQGLKKGLKKKNYLEDPVWMGIQPRTATHVCGTTV